MLPSELFFVASTSPIPLAHHVEEEKMEESDDDDENRLCEWAGCNQLACLKFSFKLVVLNFTRLYLRGTKIIGHSTISTIRGYKGLFIT